MAAILAQERAIPYFRIAPPLRIKMAGMIPVIVLAAGSSTRMGKPKGTLPCPGGGTFLTRIATTFLEAGADDVVVVVGQDGQALIENFETSGLPVRFVENQTHAAGQLTSLVAGLQLVDRPGVLATLVTLVDIPLVSADTVRAVIDRYLKTRVPIVRPTSGVRHGHPLLIGRSLFDAIRHAKPETSAKPVVRAHASVVGDIEIDDEGAFTDVDTPADYENLIRVSGAVGARTRNLERR